MYKEQLRKSYEEEVNSIKGKQKGKNLYIPKWLPSVNSMSFLVSSFNEITTMYMWGVQLNKIKYYGRSWSDFKLFLTELREVYGLGENRVLTVFVEDLSLFYDFTNKLIEFSEIRKHPTMARTFYSFVFEGVCFRDCIALNNMEKIITKANSDQQEILRQEDIFTIKTSFSKTTEKDKILLNTKLDVAAAIGQVEMDEIDPKQRKNIPTTMGKKDRKHMKKELLQHDDWVTQIKKIGLNEGVWNLLKKAKTYGLNSVNPTTRAKLLEEIESWDINSAYPSYFCTRKFPVSRFDKVEKITKATVEECINKYACLMEIELTDYELKIPFIEDFISRENKQKTLVCTEIDYLYITKVYKGKLKIKQLYIAKKDYLPKSYIELILSYYQNKTILKNTDDLYGYQRGKRRLNAIYGNNLLKPLSELEKYNIQTRKGYYVGWYPWGVWCCAYGRLTLISLMARMGEDAVYCDADCIKTKNDYTKLFEQYNQKQKKLIEKVCTTRSIDSALFTAETQLGETKTLGMFEWEGRGKFKVLSQKRYITNITEDEEDEFTVAGLPKRAFELYKLKHTDIYEDFNDELVFSPQEAFLIKPFIYNEETSGEVIDYNGDRVSYAEKSYALLKRVGYSFQQDGLDDLEKLLGGILNGY